MSTDNKDDGLKIFGIYFTNQESNLNEQLTAS